MAKCMLDGPCNVNELLNRNVFNTYFQSQKETKIMFRAL